MKVEIEKVMNGFVLSGNNKRYICATFEELVIRQKEMLGEATRQDSEWELRRNMESVRAGK